MQCSSSQSSERIHRLCRDDRNKTMILKTLRELDLERNHLSLAALQMLNNLLKVNQVCFHDER